MRFAITFATVTAALMLGANAQCSVVDNYVASKPSFASCVAAMASYTDGCLTGSCAYDWYTLYPSILAATNDSKCQTGNATYINAFEYDRSRQTQCNTTTMGTNWSGFGSPIQAAKCSSYSCCDVTNANRYIAYYTSINSAAGLYKSTNYKSNLTSICGLSDANCSVCDVAPGPSSTYCWAKGITAVSSTCLSNYFGAFGFSDAANTNRSTQMCSSSCKNEWYDAISSFGTTGGAACAVQALLYIPYVLNNTNSNAMCNSTTLTSNFALFYQAPYTISTSNCSALSCCDAAYWEYKSAYAKAVNSSDTTVDTLIASLSSTCSISSTNCKNICGVTQSASTGTTGGNGKSASSIALHPLALALALLFALLLLA
jgi:hypothetical protein